MNEPVTESRMLSHGLAGDFWYSKITEDQRPVVRALQQSVFNSGAFSMLKECMDWATEQPTLASNLSVKLDRKTVLVVSRDLQRRIRTVLETEEGTQLILSKPPSQGFGLVAPWYELKYPPADYVVSTVDGDYILYPRPDADDAVAIPKDWVQTLFIAPVPSGLNVRGIAQKDGLMLQGIDFLQREMFLLFKEDPFVLFPDGYIPVLAAARRRRPLHGYQLSTDNGSANAISRYKKRATTPENFRLAAAAAAGLVVLPESGSLLGVTTTAEGTTYTFTYGDVAVNYPHTELIRNTYYEAGQLVGAGFTVKTGRKDPYNRWWRSFDWTDGLSLDGLCLFDGLVVQDGNQVFTAYDQTGNKLHVRVGLTEDSELDDKFWAHVKQCEVWSGKYLNDVIGITSLNDTQEICPLDFFFEHLLEDRAIIVELDRLLLGDVMYAALQTFLQNEKPIGYVLIIREST